LGDVLEPGVPSKALGAFEAHAAEMLRLLDAVGGTKGAT
jgi:hypothetical protein